MNIESESLDGGVLKITLQGRMDVQGAQDVDLKFSGYTATRRLVIVDLSEVNFLASMGIRSILLVAKAIAARGGKVALYNPDANVTKVLETAGVDSIIPICRSVDEACKAVSA